MRKSRIVFVVLVTLLSILTSCGKQASNSAIADNPSMNAVSSISVNGTACRIDVQKNYGGQETGLRFSIVIPRSVIQEEANVALMLECSSDWSVSEDSNCIVQMDASNVIVDLSVEEPVIILKADAMDVTRCYHLAVE